MMMIILMTMRMVVVWSVCYSDTAAKETRACCGEKLYAAVI